MKWLKTISMSCLHAVQVATEVVGMTLLLLLTTSVSRFLLFLIFHLRASHHIFWLYSSPCYTSSQTYTHFLYLSNSESSLLLLKPVQSNLCSSQVHGLLLECGWPPRGHRLRENMLFLSKQLSIAGSPWAQGGPLCVLPSQWGLCLS